MRRITFDSGPLEGEIVDWMGHDVLLPVRRSVAFVARHEAVPPPSLFKDALYRAWQDYDGRWWYVREP